MRDQFKRFRRTARYFVVLAVVRLIQRQPASALPRLERLLKKLITPFYAHEKQRTIELLPVEFADRCSEIIDGMMHNQICNLLEMILLEKLVASDPDFITLDGREHLDAAQASGKGAIILTAHFGNWELIAYNLVAMGWPLHVIVRPQAIDRMTQLMNEFREKRGVHVLMKDNLTASLKILQERGLVGIVSDLNAREWGYQVPFFGRAASFYPTPIILSQRSGAPLLPAFIERDHRGRHHIRIENPIIFDRSEPMQERVKRYVERYEAAFRRRPDQWVWFHERYRHVDLGRT
ncbi:MAG: lysophospholipid acyltransferase family protein [Candidatus Riflebacteria bacterium]|nr:lysophospholipid acyltransferase family protein [Candidatus Riflebacteria bacterium]